VRFAPFPLSGDSKIQKFKDSRAIGGNKQSMAINKPYAKTPESLNYPGIQTFKDSKIQGRAAG
jgi:hypothetical protein